MIEVIKFGATWCVQCKQANTIMLGFSRPITAYDVDTNKDIATKYNITGLPTYIVLKDGIEVNRIIGATPNMMGRIIDIIENA